MKKIIIILSLFLLITGCSKQEYSTNLFYMDTIIQVKIYNISKNKSDDAFKEIEKIYQTYQNVADNYSENSELYQLNHKQNQKIPLSNELNNLLEVGLDWFQLSDGLLNINIGSLTTFWNDVKTGNKVFPTDEQLSDIDIDINHIKLKNKILTTDEHVNIDLGAITKGYVTEVAGNYLESIGIDTYLINAGGNVKTGKSNKGYYTVGIASPNQANENMMIIKVENKSVVTSGGYERFFEHNGILYHHIIDPNTKYPSIHMKSVTVIGNDSGQCDALSTILFLMSIEEGKNFIKDYDVDVIWYSNDNQIIKSDGFNYE